MRTFKSIATKVSPQTEQALKNICAKKGITIYDMLQMMCDCMVRYMDTDHNLTPELEQAMSIFEHMDGWNNAFNVADYTTNPEVNEAIYFVGDSNKKGVRALLVQKPWMGQWGQSWNIQMILERCICLMMPERYIRLRQMAIDMECESLLQVIDKLIDEHSNDAYLKTIREEFEDANRSDFGTKPSEHRYKQVRHRDVDAVAQQLKIRFAPGDTPDLSELNDTPAP